MLEKKKSAAKAGLMGVKQEEFLCAADKRINILTGSVRSGKTWISLLKWALYVAAGPEGADFLMAGNTAGTLERNCLNVLAELAGKENFSYSPHLMRGELFGRRIWLVGAGDATCEGKIRGMTLGGAYLDELTLLRKDFFMTLLSRLSLPDAALYATTNPDGPSHWVMSEVIKSPKMDAAVWEFKLEDNAFLPKEYVGAIKNEYAGVFYERYILGLWTACEGAVYRKFIENRSGFLTERAGIFREINVGVDFGGSRSAHAFVACGFAEGAEVSGRSEKTLVALASERVAENLDPLGLYERIIAFLAVAAKKYGDESVCLNVWCDGAEPVLIRGLRNAINEMPREFTARVRAARKRRIMDRIRGTLTLMARGRFFYTDDCKSLESALNAAVWKNDGERLDDGSTDVDTLDAFEYAWERELERLI